MDKVREQLAYRQFPLRYEGGQRFLDPVQQWSSLGRFVVSQLGAPYGAPSTNLSGPQASLGGHMGVSGEQQSLEGTRAPELQVGGPGFPSVQGFWSFGVAGWSRFGRCESV